MNATQFSLFTRQHREALARVALNFFHDAEAAADIVQETLLRLWVVRARLRAEADFLALGIRIAKNLCVNEWKRRQRHAVAGEPMPETPSSTDTAAPLEEQENQHRLHAALATLTSTERRIFNLWRDEQMEVAQIAEIMGCLPTTVSNTLYRTKRKLFTLIQSTL